MIPNIVTALRIFLIPLIISFLLLDMPLWAAVFFLICALTDALDGYLARKLKQMTSVGKFLDPLADKLLVISVLVVLVGKGSVSSLPVLLIITREFAVTGLRIAGKVSQASFLSKIKTAVQIIAALMLILNLSYAQAVLWLAVIISVISGVDYVRNT